MSYLNIGLSRDISLSVNGHPIFQMNVVHDLGRLYSNNPT